MTKENYKICRDCSAIIPNVGPEAVSSLCWECVSEIIVQIDSLKIKKQTMAQGFPKGWKFMKVFVHANGGVYYKGVEQPKLRGTLSTTIIVVKPKKSKVAKEVERLELLKSYDDLKKQLKKATKKGAIKKLTVQLKKIEKQIK